MSSTRSSNFFKKRKRFRLFSRIKKPLCANVAERDSDWEHVGLTTFPTALWLAQYSSCIFTLLHTGKFPFPSTGGVTVVTLRRPLPSFLTHSLSFSSLLCSPPLLLEQGDTGEAANHRHSSDWVQTSVIPPPQAHSHWLQNAVAGWRQVIWGCENQEVVSDPRVYL